MATIVKVLFEQGQVFAKCGCMGYVKYENLSKEDQKQVREYIKLHLERIDYGKEFL